MVQHRKDIRLERLTRSNQTMVGTRSRYARAGAGTRSRWPQVTTTFTRLLSGLLVAILLMVPVGTIPVSGQPVSECVSTLEAPSAVTSVHVQPGAGVNPILDEIDNARCSIDLVMYLFTADEIVAGLHYAEQRGVRVRVILEPNPFGSYGTQQDIFDELVAIGAEVQWSPPAFQFMHAKYMIVDRSALVVTNQNFTNSGFNSNREFGVVTTQPGQVAEAVQIFESDWSGTDGPKTLQHLIVSPINSRSTIIELINGSRVSVSMYAEVLRDEDVTHALDNAVARGVNVRLLVNPTTSEDDVPYFLDAMSHGVQVRVLENPYVHSKALVVDQQFVLIGSQNYSYTSLNLNREVGIVLSDEQSLTIVSSTFETDWSRAIPVDSISITLLAPQSGLTSTWRVGKLSSGRWGVV